MKSIDLMAALLLHVQLANAETGVGDGHVGGEAQKRQRAAMVSALCTCTTTEPPTLLAPPRASSSLKTRRASEPFFSPFPRTLQSTSQANGLQSGF